jgi:hypothetical protein
MGASRRRLPWRAWLAGLASCGLAAGAHAAEGESGLFTWRPSLSVSAVASDNVFYDEGDEEGSIGAWIAPRLELSYRRPALELGADLGVDFRRWIEQSSLSSELYRAAAWARAGLGHGLSARLSNAFVPQPLRVGLPEDEGRNLVQTNRLAGDLRWSRPLPGRRELELGVQGSWFRSDESAELVPGAGGPALDPSFRSDYAEGLGFVELQSPLGERSSAWVRAQGSHRSFREDSRADHENLSLLLGWRSSRFENLDLELAGGVGALGFERFADELRALGRVGLRYRLPAAWALSLAAHHLNTPNLAGDEALESTGELGVEKRFGIATLAGLRIFATRFDGDLRAGDANLFGGAELSVRHQVNRSLQLLVAYRHWRNAGALGLDDFAQNRLVLQLSLRR